MGGRVGLKGTDSRAVLREALKRGARPISQQRTMEALKEMERIKDKVSLLCYSGEMGEEAALRSGYFPVIIGSPGSSPTSAGDTKNAAKKMVQRNVDLLLFAGGDGTARDIFRSMGTSCTVLGIPSGVKIHSGVFAQNPKKAGDLASLFLEEKIKSSCEAEVMDIDEKLYRKGEVKAKLYGYLKIPLERRYVQNVKAGSLPSEKCIQEAIACEVVENMSDDFLYIVGPGTTTRAVMEKLNLDCSLLGIDLVFQKKLIGKDLNEAELRQKIQGTKAKMILTPVGGQGYILGRGNLPISPEIVNQVGKDNIIIIATKQKIHSLNGRPLLADTGDRKTDMLFEDYFKVITGYREAIIYRATS